MEEKWWTKAKMPSVFSMKEFKTLLNSKSKDKHIFVEFYSPNCFYCYQFMNDFNNLYDYLMSTYGKEQVEVYKINGYDVPDGTQFFQIPYFPYFLYFKPNSGGTITSRFLEYERTYDSMKRWMLTQANTLVPKESGSDDELAKIDIDPDEELIKNLDMNNPNADTVILKHLLLLFRKQGKALDKQYQTFNTKLDNVVKA